MSQYDSKAPQTQGAADDAAVGTGAHGAHIGAVNAALTSPGGMPYGGARLHNDATSHAAADALGARAFTAGSSVFLGAGQPQPGTPQGDQLLRHELMHVEQSRGIAAPEPGNFRVSDPGDAEEHAARSGQSGETAQPHTIYRDAHGGRAPAKNGAGPAARAKTDPYKQFKEAIDAGDRTQATALWDTLSADIRARTRREPEKFLTKVIQVMKKDAAEVLRSAHANLGQLADDIMASSEFAEFMPEMRRLKTLDDFISAPPRKGEVSDQRARRLQLWVEQAANVDEARALFQKVYPRLRDNANPELPFGAKADPWRLAQVRRLYEILSHFVPVGHVQTISGGFVIQNTVKFGWYEFANHRVGLPGQAGSRRESRDGSDHDMTGGDDSGSRRRYTAPDGTAGTNVRVGHHTITALHEIGHGVGDRMGGHAYADDRSNFPGWTHLSAEEWADGLMAKPAGDGDDRVPKEAQLEPNQARRMFIHEIKEGPGTYVRTGISHADMVKWVKTRYANVPLFKWWQHLVDEGKSKDAAYRFEDESARVRGGWTYAFLTRAGDPFMKLKTKAFEKRVSWYSVSSPFEWFAEQYAHYYRTEKTGGGLIDDDTKKFLDRLDRKDFKGGRGRGDGGYRGEDGGEGGGKADQDQQPLVGSSKGAQGRGESGDARTQDAPAVEPLFFPW